MRQGAGPSVSVPPTLLRLPDGDFDFSRSQIVLDFMAEAGYVFDDWQAYMAWWSNARDPGTGDLAAKTIYGEVPRQNGKNIWLEGDQITGLCLFGYRLFTHSGYRADTVHEHFLSMQEHILDSPLLREYVKPVANQGFFSANGKEAIEFANGSRLLFKTRSQQVGRGPRPQKLYYDEALILPQDAVDAQVPSIVAQAGNQVVFTSSAPLSSSGVAHGLRSRAASTEDETDTRFFAISWNNKPGVDSRDREAQARVNPSLGLGRMTHESINENLRLMSLGGFIREHLGVPDEAEDMAEVPIPEDIWLNLIEASSAVATDRAWALAVSADRKWATLGVAGRRTDGLFHVEWKTRKPGLGWVVQEVITAQATLDLPLRVWERGPEGSFIPRLEKAGVKVEPVSTAEVSQYTANLIDGAKNGELRHLGQNTLTAQLAAATLRVSTDGVPIWAIRDADTPLDALVAVTVALGGIFEPEPEKDGDWFAY